MAKLTKAQADKIAELQATADGYRDMIANENDMAMCDKYFEIVEKCESQIAAIRKQAGQGGTMERQAIEIKYPNYTYELQVDQYGEFEYWDAGNNVEAFYPYIRNKSGKIGYYNYAWRIVRTSDNVVIAQSKAPVATPDPDPDDSEPLPVADAPVDAENATADPQPVSRYLIINRVIDTEPMECDTIDETLQILSELREDGESLINWLVQEWQGDSLIESVFAKNWYVDNVTPHKTGDIVTISGVQHEVQVNGILKQLPPVAPQPVSRVQWRKREDMVYQTIDKPYPMSWHWWGDWFFRDFHNAPISRNSKPPRDLQAKKVSLPNMQKTDAKTPNKRRAMTSRQLGRMLKAEPISRKPKQRSALQVQRDLMFLNWIMGDRAA